MATRKLHRLPWDVTLDPCDVARRNFVRLARTDDEGRAVVSANSEPAGNCVADVSVLTRLRAGDRSDVARPVPARLEDKMANRDLVEANHLNGSVRKPSDLVGRAEPFSLKAGH